VEPALRLSGVSKSFGPTVAIRDLDLAVPQGALYGFIGPNGAGKTTCIRMIMAILFPDTGELAVLGRRSAVEAKDRIGYLPEERGVYRKMRVGAFLQYVAQLKGLASRDAAARSRELLERVGLGSTARKRCEELSKGMLQRVQIAAAIVHRPDLLILDEPFSGLDPVSVRLLRDLIVEEHRRGATVLFSTHVMSQAEDICQHVVMVHRGKKVLDEPTASLRRRFDLRAVQFEPLAHEADVSAVAALPGIERVDRIDTGYRAQLAAGADPVAAIRRIAGAVEVARVEVARLSLEDVFIGLVSGGADDEQALKASLRDLDAQGAAV
jgi:ABC-2 type transport system ATP-binding protein